MRIYYHSVCSHVEVQRAKSTLEGSVQQVKMPSKEEELLNFSGSKSYQKESDLLSFLIIGSFLVFAGTPVLYVLYSTSEYETYSSRRTPLPLLTDMFGDWPWLSSVVVGLGITILFTGLLGTAIAKIPRTSALFRHRVIIVRYSVIAQISAWMVIPANQAYINGNEVFYWIHSIAAFVFVCSAIYVLFVCIQLCNFFVQTIVDIALAVPMQGDSCEEENSRNRWMIFLENGMMMRSSSFWAQMCLWVAIVALIGATVSVVVIGSGDWGHTTGSKLHMAPQYLWQILAVCELCILLFAGIAYALVIDTCVGIEESSCCLEFDPSPHGPWAYTQKHCVHKTQLVWNA